MPTVEPPLPSSRKRSLVVACIKVALGPFNDGARLDRAATGAAGGVLVLAAIALPVTVAAVTTSKAVPGWVLTLCALAGIVGLALVVKSCQRPRSKPHPPPPHPSLWNPFDHSPDTSIVPTKPSEIIVEESTLAKSSISIPEGSSAQVIDSELTDSPLTIRDQSQAKPKLGNG